MVPVRPWCPLVTMTCGLSLPCSFRWARQRCSTAQLVGSSGTGCGRLPIRRAWVWRSMSSMRSSRASWLEAPCRSASIPTKASCGWTSATVVQRRNRALLVDGESSATEVAGLLDGQAFGGVDQHQALGAGEAEETGAAQSAAACGTSACRPGTPRCLRRRPTPTGACRARRRGSGRGRAGWPARFQWCGRCAAGFPPGGRVPAPAASRRRSLPLPAATARGPHRRGVAAARQPTARPGRWAGPGGGW